MFYLDELKVWNFRKYGSSMLDEGDPEPGLKINFQRGVNVLIGENGSGKSTIIDAIKIVLLTKSGEWIQIEEQDFHTENGKTSKDIRIECIFKGFTNEEAAPFLEWIGFDDQDKYCLKVMLTAENRNESIVRSIRAGMDPEGSRFDGSARDLLRTTYLKPLRDPDAELSPGRRSRLAQILKSHPALKYFDTPTNEHPLEKIVKESDEGIKKYFLDDKTGKENAAEIKSELKKHLDSFLIAGNDPQPEFSLSGTRLVDILRKLDLRLDEAPPGLGVLNLLYIAMELLLLSDVKRGLKLALVEELEAHLDPTSQLRVIHYLENELAQNGERQFILTTHSTTLGSHIDLNKLIILQANDAYPMGSDFTNLDSGDYAFLERFLDATRSNLFFARGVILVEGISEQILISTLAEKLERPLHKYGITIVNVGGTAFLRYVNIFLRQDDQIMPIPVSVIIDLDLNPLDEDYNEERDKQINLKKGRYKDEQGNIRVFVSPTRTFEYEIALSNFQSELLEASVRAATPSEELRVKYRDEFEQAENKENWIMDDFILKRQISKGAIAQFLSEIFNEIDDTEFQSRINQSETLSYLVEAIEWVTNSANEEVEDAGINSN